MEYYGANSLSAPQKIGLHYAQATSVNRLAEAILDMTRMSILVRNHS